MLISTWLRGKRSGKQIGRDRRRPKTRLTIQRLEDRTVLNIGALDPTFGNGGIVSTDVTTALLGSLPPVESFDEAFAVGVQGNGQIVVAGTVSYGYPFPNTADFAVARYSPDGTLDSTFGTNGVTTTDFGPMYGRPFQYDIASGVAIQSDGKIVVAGWTSRLPGGGLDADFAVARFNTDGTLDSTFGVGGRRTVDVSGSADTLSGITIQPDGKIVVSGNGPFETPSITKQAFSVARLNTDGNLDSSFGGGGIVRTPFSVQFAFPTAITLQSVGSESRIVVAGPTQTAHAATGIGIVRYLPNGTLDASFGIGGILQSNLFADARGITIQSVNGENALLVAGPNLNEPYHFALGRFHANGALDNTFGLPEPTMPGTRKGWTATYFGGLVCGVAVESISGRIVVAGAAGGIGVARYEPDGLADLSFGFGGQLRTGINVWPNAMTLQDDGHLLVVGRFNTPIGNDFLVARYALTRSTADAGGPYAISEGQSLVLDGRQTQDADAGRILTYSWDVNGDGIFGDASGPTPYLTWTQLNALGINSSPHMNDVRVRIDDGQGYVFDSPATTLTITPALPSRVQGIVYVDFNNDGEVDFGEQAVPGVTVTLTGTDYHGELVNLTMQTDANGIYNFTNLRPSTFGGYTITETQPPAYPDGRDTQGTVNGVYVGNNSVNDILSGVVVSLGDSLAENYNFGERPANGGSVGAGQTATIGFWQNKNGQNLIKALNGGANATQLGSWLAATFPNMYGMLDGVSNTDVASHYKSLFGRNGQSSPGGPPKVDAQIMATALAVYVTNQSLAGNTATAYGFQVTQFGVGTRTFNVGIRGAAFGVANNSSLSVMDLLLAVNARSHNGLLYDTNGDGVVSAGEAGQRTMANDLFSLINEAGGI